jgi:hypothetical protein
MDAAQLIAAFVRLGFGNDAAAVLTDRNKEDVQIDSLKYFNDKAVKILCDTLRKPGWTEDVPGLGQRALARTIPNPGIYVSARAEMNLKSACFLAMHYQRTSRTLTTANLTVERVHRFARYKEAEEAYNVEIKVFRLERPEKIMDFIDDWPSYLALYNGQNAIPLDYIIRENVTVPADAMDPSFGEYGSMYASLRDEIASRADHQAPQYRVDNAKVFELLCESVAEHKHIDTWVKPYATLRDGRGAWLNLMAHCQRSSTFRATVTTDRPTKVRNVAGFKRNRTSMNYRSKKRNNDKKRTGEKVQGSFLALDRYYEPRDWWELNQETRAKILLIRKKKKIPEVVSSTSIRRIIPESSKSDDTSDKKLRASHRWDKKEDEVQSVHLT